MNIMDSMEYALSIGTVRSVKKEISFCPENKWRMGLFTAPMEHALQVGTPPPIFGSVEVLAGGNQCLCLD
ncbi:MAG: hypothetical protein AAB428_02545 [Patescibacteria group bacterium]